MATEIQTFNALLDTINERDSVEKNFVLYKMFNKLKVDGYTERSNELKLLRDECTSCSGTNNMLLRYFLGPELGSRMQEVKNAKFKPDKDTTWKDSEKFIKSIIDDDKNLLLTFASMGDANHYATVVCQDKYCGLYQGWAGDYTILDSNYNKFYTKKKDCQELLVDLMSPKRKNERKALFNNHNVGQFWIIWVDHWEAKQAQASFKIAIQALR